MRNGLKQQFVWVSSGTMENFIGLMNRCGDEGYELWQIYPNPNGLRGFGALMTTWVDARAEKNENRDTTEAAKILKLVRDEDEDTGSE